MNAQQLFNQALESHYEVCEEEHCDPDAILDYLFQEVIEEDYATPVWVQSITKEYGIMTIPLVENGGLNVAEDALPFSQLYGNNSWCELNDDDCSDDGILWQADDMGGPHFCTNHYFLQEQLGYEFIKGDA